jgi:signal transduction histidine kinase
VALVASLFAILIALDMVIQEQVLLPSFAELERVDAHTSMTRIGFALDRALESMEMNDAAWSNWGELYQFMQDRNPQFIATYTTPTALAALKINVLLLVDRDGHFIFSSAREVESGKPLDIDFAGRGELPADFPWRRNLKEGKPARGLVRTNQGVMMLSAAPIFDGSGGGRNLGMTIMGRLLTADQLQAIGTEAQASLLMLYKLRPAAAPDLVETATLTQVYRTFEDVYGHPLMTLKVDVARKITARGHTAVLYSSLYLLGAAVTVLVLLLLIVNRVVLGPIFRVTRHAVAVGEGADLSARLNFSGTDEIGRLAREFDRMVQSLAESRASLVDQSFQAGFAELAKGVLHNLGNAMTPIGLRLASLANRLRSAPVADIQFAAAELADESADAGRRADLACFIKMGFDQVGTAILHAQSDIAVLEQQTSIVSATLAEQMASSRSEPVVERVALPDLLSQALDIVPDSCRQRLAIEADESLKAVGPVPLARTLLRLVLQNLIINAADAVDESRREKGVLHIAAAIESDADAQRLHLRCTDNGIGIKPENLARIFEKGFSTKSRAANHGIGLHWCANAIRSLGGRIWASSEGPGTGASLHVVLPVAVARSAGRSPSAAAA